MNGLGLWNATNDAAPIALTGVRITARVTALGQRTVVEQVFTNREPQPIEAIYTFPLPEGAAVCGFEAITGERVLTGKIEELGAGMEKYEQAVSEGHGAFLAELWRPDVFSTRIGNLKPNQAVLIRLTYVSDVDLHEHKLRVSFPTTIAPRYATSTASDPIEAAMDADALNPPHVLAVPYGLELSAEIDLGLPLKSVGSPTHGVRVEHGAGEAWKVTLAAEKTEMNRNVVIEADMVKATTACAMLEEGVEPGETFAAVTFLPEFEVSELGEVAPREIVFVLDCSGSMEGPSIEQAKRALALCLKCLNEGDRFNICRFGSTFELMQPESIPYTQGTLDAALAYVGKIRADLGGTELYRPLQWVFTGGNSRQVREVILLTDGQVSNEPALNRMALGARGQARIFSFGIGPACSEFLVRGLARSTGGAAAFIAQNERIEDHVMRTFARMASPRIDAIDITWQGSSGEHRGEVDMEPQQIASLFDGELLRISARLRGELPQQVTLIAMLNGSRKTWTVPLKASAARAANDQPGMIGAAWTRQRLAALELAATPVVAGMTAGRRFQTIVELSKRYGILSKETTLIAIEHRSLEERASGKPEQRRVPVMLAAGWGGVESGSIDKVVRSAAHFAAPAPASPAPGAVSASKKTTLGWLREKISPPADGTRYAVRDRGPDEPQVSFSISDPLSELLWSQTAEGDFREDHSLNTATLGGKPWNRDAHIARLDPVIKTTHRGQRERILATALTILALRECFADRQDLWMTAVKKALRWLKKRAPEVYALLDQPAPVK